MADAPVVHIGENSPEQVALKLLNFIASNEKKMLSGSNANADRNWILTTYARCLYTVRNPNWVNDALSDKFGGS